ncbi:NAD(P)H-dependent FMN reductase [Azospirillum melinis]|nr:NAD(P)H-dependent FMN reductase [Azospirillum melinis]
MDEPYFEAPDLGKLTPGPVSTHPPRILLLYGSLRERSYSRFLAEEVARSGRQRGITSLGSSCRSALLTDRSGEQMFGHEVNEDADFR